VTQCAHRARLIRRQLEDFSTTAGVARIQELMSEYFGWPPALLNDVGDTIHKLGHINPTKSGHASKKSMVDAFTPALRREFNERFGNTTLARLGYPPDPFGRLPGYLVSEEHLAAPGPIKARH
jgi:hypothetical protein